MLLNRDRLRELLLITGLCGFLFFFRLSGIGLLGPDEPRYAQIAREMLQGHNWVTPYLYGHTWLEKPILLYWAEMLSYTLYGVADWAARVPSAVFATGMVAGVFITVRRIRHDARLDAALMVASSALVLGFARAASTDMLLAAPFTVALLCWFGWYQAEYAENGEADAATRHPRLYLALFYVLAAVATLAKGPVAPGLAGLVLIVFCLVERNPRAILRTLNPVGIVLFLAVAAPWFVAVQQRTPEFFRVFFLQHNLARFGSNLYRHHQPFWYYIPVALAAALPWTVWLFPAVGEAWRALRRRLRGESDPAESCTFEVFLLLWAAVPIVFFSLSHSKLPGYILPAMPALMILAAVGFHRSAAQSQRPHWLAICCHAVLLAGMAAALCITPRLLFKLPSTPPQLMAAAVAGTFVFLIVALPLLTSGWRMLRFVTLLPLILMVGFVLRGLSPVVDATQSSRPVAILLQAIQQPGALPLATFGVNRNMALGLAFYLDRRVAPYEGLEVSPAVYELPAAVPQGEHILVVREGSLPALHALLGSRALLFLGSDRAQHIEIYRVGAQD
ncbi:MAG: glycosyltransferase family 39 protein [Acidobacteriota bacterium]|nr:glycosyltransferase family 39 protein [Acidobacteriota bacterium]